jgi:hypothetical protein
MADRRSGLQEMRGADVVAASWLRGTRRDAASTLATRGACCARHRGVRPRLRGGAARPAVTPYLIAWRDALLRGFVARGRGT